MELVVLDDHNFETYIKSSDTPIFIDLLAEWCKPCIRAQPTLMDLADEYDGKMKFAKINVATNQMVEKRYDVRSIPRYLIIDKKMSIIEDFLELNLKKNMLNILYLH